MLIKKIWSKKGSYGVILADCEGWFIFGIIPLYVKVIKRI